MEAINSSWLVLVPRSYFFFLPDFRFVCENGDVIKFDVVVKLCTQNC